MYIGYHTPACKKALKYWYLQFQLFNQILKSSRFFQAYAMPHNLWYGIFTINSPGNSNFCWCYSPGTYIKDKSKISICWIVLNNFTKEILFNLFCLKISIWSQCQKSLEIILETLELNLECFVTAVLIKWRIMIGSWVVAFENEIIFYD